MLQMLDDGLGMKEIVLGRFSISLLHLLFVISIVVQDVPENSNLIIHLIIKIDLHILECSFTCYCK